MQAVVTRKLKNDLLTKSPRKKKPPGYWNNKTNVFQFLSTLKNTLQLKTPEDWNNLKSDQIKQLGGSGLFNNYSLFQLKCLGCPESTSQINNKYENNQEEDVILFLNKLKEKLNIKTVEDWNKITRKQIYSNGGYRFFKKYSLYDLKCLGFPAGKYFFKSQPKPDGYWENEENVKQFLLQFKEKFNVNTFDDWNLVTKQQIESFGGASLFKKYSLCDLKCLGFPDGDFNSQKPSGYWNDKQNILQFLNDLGVRLQLTSFDDWNLLTWKQIESMGGSSLLNKYSLYEIKCMAFPDGEFKFHPPPRSFKPAGFWENENNVLSFLDDIKRYYNLCTPNDWNSLTKKQITSFGGSRLLTRLSMFEIKSLACPEGKLIFTPSPKPPRYWDHNDNVIKFLHELRCKLKLKTLEDWLRLSKNQIIAHGGDGLALKYSMHQIIQLADQCFDFGYVANISNSKSKRSSQRWLFLQMKQLFPDEEMVEDYFHSEISRQTGYAVQFDIFLIGKNIAVEYHGKQHYEDIPSYGYAPFELYTKRDAEKISICEEFGILLIVIPYWWDNTLQSLKTTIDKHVV